MTITVTVHTTAYMLAIMGMVVDRGSLLCHMWIITMLDPGVGSVLKVPLTCCALQPPVVPLPGLATHRDLVCASLIWRCLLLLLLLQLLLKLLQQHCAVQAAAWWHLD